MRIFFVQYRANYYKVTYDKNDSPSIKNIKKEAYKTERSLIIKKIVKTIFATIALAAGIIAAGVLLLPPTGLTITLLAGVTVMTAGISVLMAGIFKAILTGYELNNLIASKDINKDFDLFTNALNIASRSQHRPLCMHGGYFDPTAFDPVKFYLFEAEGLLSESQYEQLKAILYKDDGHYVSPLFKELKSMKAIVESETAAM